MLADMLSRICKAFLLRFEEFFQTSRIQRRFGSERLQFSPHGPEWPPVTLHARDGGKAIQRPVQERPVVNLNDFVARLAKVHGLVCFDPQTRSVR